MKGNIDLYNSLKQDPAIFYRSDKLLNMADNLFIDALQNHIAANQLPNTELKICKLFLSYYSKNCKKISFHKNPELYSSLNEYINCSVAKSKDDALYKLGLQLGFHKYTDFTRHDLLRLYHFQKKMYVSKEVIELSEKNSLQLKDSFSSESATIILPLKNIFSGFISSTIYPENFKTNYKIAALTKRIEKSINLIYAYSTTLSSDFFRIINYIFLTPNFNNKVRFSYNLRTGYLGAIFINEYVTNKISFAESLIHEFIHQRLWLQWAYEFSDLNRLEKIEILSPFTNRLKSITVMMHAYIIYNVIHDFHKFILSNCNPGKSEVSYLKINIENSKNNLPVLNSRLLEKIPPESSLNNVLINLNTILNNKK